MTEDNETFVAICPICVYEASGKTENAVLVAMHEHRQYVHMEMTAVATDLGPSDTAKRSV